MDRKTLLGVIAVGLIIFMTPYYYKLIMPAPPEEPASEVVADSVAALTETPEADATQKDNVLPESSLSSVAQTNAIDPSDTPWYAADPANLAETVTVETPLYSAEFSTRGASVQSWIIKPVRSYFKESEQLIISKYAARNLVMTARGGRGLLRTEEKNFTVNQTSIELGSKSQPQSFVFTLPLPDGSFYKETYTFYPDRYDFDVHIESQGLSDLTGAVNAEFSWGGALNMTEEDTLQDLYYSEAHYLMGNSLETLKSKGKKAKEESATGLTDWVSIRTKYFTMAMVPQVPASGARLYTWPDNEYNGKNRPKLYESSLQFNMNNDGELDQRMRVYLGPLDQKDLLAVSPTLPKTMSWGMWFVRPFSKGVYYSLVFLHKFIPNYGFVLLIFSVLIKLIVWPLTHKSYSSMKRMQLVQPILKATQDRYKDNPQKMQQEVMGIYKEYKVNPMGGCLPSLIQMPLLFGLFVVFRSTIALRGQPFFLWISDLSMPDTLFNLPFSIPLYGSQVALLPIVMGLSMFMQQKMTSASSDPNQKAMMYMMPVMMVFLFNKFPSGLTLYYTLFNFLSVAQQKLMRVSDPDLEKKLEEAKQDAERELERKERRKAKKARKEETPE